MPSIKIDGREVSFEPGDTIIKAAHRAGIDIPHYCWHPGLSVAANCRMCLVEVVPPPGKGSVMRLDVLRWDAAEKKYVNDKKPKLQPACQWSCDDGMQVFSESSPHVSEARKAVQELLLLNHPVDCPICDQAGECRLQDYWLEHGRYRKRMTDEIVHKPKAVSFGPTIVYDAERCIVCTRCVRFVDEIAKDPVLEKRERGNLGEIFVAPGRKLENNYTLMTEHVCPVGALTAKDFRFKARVWFLRTARTVCQGCATGCNAYLDYDPRSMKVYRHRPRENAQVNQYWMCDKGMLSYPRAHEGRVVRAQVGGAGAGRQKALDEVKALLAGAKGDKIAFVLSAQHSNEDNYALVALAKGALGGADFYLAGRAAGQGDGVLMVEDRNPNTAGAIQVASTTAPRPFSELLEAVKNGRYTHLIALGADVPVDPKAIGGLERLKTVVIAAHEGPLARIAKVLLPACSWAEAEGTYVNNKGLAQRSERAIPPQGESQPGWQWVVAVAQVLGHKIGFGKLSELRKSLSGAPTATTSASL